MASGVYSKFHINLDSLIIRTKDKVTFLEVRDFLKKNFQTFPIRSRFTVLCGVHHYKDPDSDVAKLCDVPDSPEVGLVSDYHSMFEVLQKDCADIIGRVFKFVTENVFNNVILNVTMKSTMNPTNNDKEFKKIVEFIVENNCFQQ